MDEIFFEPVPEKKKEELFLSEDVLENKGELYNQSNEELEIRNLKELLFQIFREIDKDDLGVVSHDECIEIFKLMQLNLSRLQIEEVVNALDQTKSGIIEYQDFAGFGAEVIHGIFCKNEAMRDLVEKEQENRFEG